MRLGALVGALQLGQLHGAIDPGHLYDVVNSMCHHGNAIGHGVLHHLGQVVLALGVAIVQARQPAFELARWRHQHAAVNLGQLALGFAGVLVLDDGAHATVSSTHDASVAVRVYHLQRQQGQTLAGAGGNQMEQRIGLDQRHIARKHQH